MKKMFCLLMIMFLSFVLVACEPNDEAQPFIDAGDKAMVDEDYKKAIDSYSNAYNKHNHKDIMAKLTDARTKRLTVLRNDYSELRSELKHKEAKEVLDEIMELFKDLIEKEVLEGYEKDAKELTLLIEKQKRLDDYILWVKPHMVELTAISNDWFVTSRSIQLNALTKIQMKKELGDLIIKNQLVMGEIDQKSLNVDPALSETHTLLYNIVLNNDTGFSAALGKLNEGAPNQEVVEAGTPADQSKVDIANFTNKIRTYASENNLRDTFQEIIYESEDVKEESTEKEVENESITESSNK